MTRQYSKVLDGIEASGIRKFFDLVIGAKNIISLGVGEPDFMTPWPIRERAITALEKGQTSYTSNAGLLDCRQAIASYLKKQFKADYNAEDEMVLTVGVSEGVDLALRALVNPGDEVILPEPCYVCYRPLAQMAGATVVSVETAHTQFIPDPDEIEKKISKNTKALILCSPSNPTGAVIPKPILEKLAKLAKKYDFWIITDEVYAEIAYEPYTSLASLPGIKEHCILLSGFSKAFSMTGWRLGYICGPKDFIKRALKIHQYNALCAPILAQYAGIEAVKNCKKEVAEMTASYQKRRDVFVAGLNEIGLKTPMPGGAFYSFSDIRSTGLSSEKFAINLLKTQKVAVVPGTAFGANGEGFIRCCYASETDELEEALKRMKKFIEKT